MFRLQCSGRNFFGLRRTCRRSIHCRQFNANSHFLFLKPEHFLQPVGESGSPLTTPPPRRETPTRLCLMVLTLETGRCSPPTRSACARA